MIPLIEEVFSSFAGLLEERFSTGPPTTEDSIRYTFFYALTATGYCLPIQILLETSHPSLPRAEIDLLILATKDRPSSAFEFKYSRKIPSENVSARTMKAGQVFNDLFRLARLPQSTALHRYFIYITDQEMMGYFMNPANRLVEFLNLGIGRTYTLKSDLMLNRPNSFADQIGNRFIDCQIECVFTKQLPNRHALRIFEVTG